MTGTATNAMIINHLLLLNGFGQLVLPFCFKTSCKLKSYNNMIMNCVQAFKAGSYLLSTEQPPLPNAYICFTQSLIFQGELRKCHSRFNVSRNSSARNRSVSIPFGQM